MTTQQEYAILSTAAYPRTRANTTTMPSGWSELIKPSNDSITGFSAGLYQKGTEYVIAYTGTNESLWKDFATGNIPASIGAPCTQVLQAMMFYIDAKKKYGNNISFTGHSMGGGLASLMAVFFGKPATTFDPAPFKNTVTTTSTLRAYQALLLAGGLSDADFNSAVSTPSLFGTRESAVTLH